MDIDFLFATWYHLYLQEQDLAKIDQRKANRPNILSEKMQQAGFTLTR